MKPWLIVIMLGVVSLIVVWRASFSAAPLAPGAQTAPVGMVYQINPPAEGGVRFEFVELWVDSGAQPLAAYQLEFRPTQGEVKIIGIEGGEHAQFTDPPYYDPRAMMSERVILADFSTAASDQLPNGKTRLATIHVQVEGDEPAKFQANLAVAAGPDGTPIHAEITLKTGGQT